MQTATRIKMYRGKTPSIQDKQWKVLPAYM